MYRKRLVSIVIVLVLVLLGFFILKYLTSFQTLTLNASSVMDGPSITVYKVPGQDNVSNPALVVNDKMIVKKVNSTSTLKLHKGRYYITATSKSTADYNKDVSLAKKSVTVDINPSLNPQLLAQRVAAEEVSIKPVLAAAYPQINHGYVLQAGRLYKQGDWYSTTLVSGSDPNPLDYHDIFHVVLHKENGTWKIKTKFPELNVDTHTYPDIPKEVLVEANKQGINF